MVGFANIGKGTVVCTNVYITFYLNNHYIHVCSFLHVKELCYVHVNFTTADIVHPTPSSEPGLDS